VIGFVKSGGDCDGRPLLVFSIPLRRPRRRKLGDTACIGLSHRLLCVLYPRPNKIRVEKCPFFNLSGYRSESLGSRADRCRNETVSLGQAGDGLPDQIHGMDAGRPAPPAGLSWDQGRPKRE
jgi:hypothetical protein